MAVSQARLARQAAWRRWARRGALGVLAGLAGGIAFAFYAQVEMVWSLQREHAVLQAEANGVLARNAELAQRLSLKDDADYLDLMARRWLGWVRPGETKVILPPGF